MPLLLVSCNEQEAAFIENKCKIVCSVDEFEATSSSRTITDPNDNYKITWASGDVIGIFPREGYQEPFEIPTNQIGNESASFDGGYWDVKDGLEYNAYYPFDKRNFDSSEMKTRIPITYSGQKQNGTSCDIGAFDYTYSDWKTATNGSVSFDFHHIGSIGVFRLKFPATTTYTKMTLSVDETLIPLNGYYDLTAEDVSMIADENSFSSSMTLNLTNCSGVAGETGTFYMMLPPMDLSNNEVTLSLTTTAGTTCTYTIEKALNVGKGKKYERTGIPTESNVEGTVDGWIEEELIPYVTFIADAVQAIQMSYNVETLEYSVNNSEWDILGTNWVQFGGEKGTLHLRGKNSKGTEGRKIKILNNNIPFACKGDIRTLIDYENYSTVNTESASFASLFSGCTALTSAPELPISNLAPSCYYQMFYGCSSLVSPPKLPATILSESCYEEMFQGSGITTAPKLPANVLADKCYQSMFESCMNLTIAPELPATTLASSCYSGMFHYCKNLISAPELPAKTLTKFCYSFMFYGCSNLVSAPELPATTIANSCYTNMFAHCTKLTSIPALPANTLHPHCYNGMFEFCYGLTSVEQELPATILANACYAGMFRGCSNLTSAPKLPATTLEYQCYSGMFNGCSNLTSSPELPAKNLVDYCYYNMFKDCNKLNNVTMLATNINAEYCLIDWLKNVSYNGTFIKATEMNSLQTESYSYIPEGWTIVNYQ